ncbi:MAG: hypothetical protein E7279_03615 [Lachnospiraceae bacterium]|nr:hypothetical protein [Lachnospiraceae bacterium]
MSEPRFINNLKGTLYYLETPLLDFTIKNRQLVQYNDLNNMKLFPPELALYGISYGNINEFFLRRTMEEGCMLYKKHLRAIGMDSFNFDEYIKRNNGNNNLDNYWVKFENYGAKNFAMLTQS